jgi:hypothetical protein
MAHGFLVSATYEDGFEITERTDNDRNPYSPDGNTLTAILTHGPTEAGHGRMVRFSLIPESGDGARYDIDWRPLWETDNPRPIYFRQMTQSISLDGSNDTGPVCQSHHFGWQHTDSDGANVQEIQEVQP